MSGCVLEQNRVNKANKMVSFKMYLWNSLYVWLSSLSANPQLSRNFIFLVECAALLKYYIVVHIYLSFPCQALWGTRDKRVYLTAWISNMKPLKCSFVPLGWKRTLGKAAGLQRFLWESIFNVLVVKCFQCVCPFRSEVPAETCSKETQHSDHFEWRCPGRQRWRMYRTFTNRQSTFERKMF